MELIYKIIDLSAFFTGIFIFAWIVGCVSNLVRIIVRKTNKEVVPKEIYKSLNPFNIPSFFMAGEKYKKSTRLVIRLIFIIGLFGLVLEGVSYSNLGSSTIGSYIEKNEYSAYYYVNMFPDGSSDTNYRVKAKINSLLVEESDDKGTYNERHYYIEKAYFENGDIITFYDWGEERTLKLNKKVSIEDDYGDNWRIELTNKKAN